MALPIGLLMLFLMGIGPMLPWGETSWKTTGRQLLAPAVGGLIAAAAWGLLANQAFASGATQSMAYIAFALGGFVSVVTLRELFLPAQRIMSEAQLGPAAALLRSASRAPRRFGGYVVHLSIVVIIVAIAASSAFKTHASGTLKPGSSLQVGAYRIRFDGLSSGKEPHRTWTSANVTVIYPDGKEVPYAAGNGPRMNFYERQTDPVGSPLVHEMVWRDVYVSLLAFDGKQSSASFNAWVFPLVGWIWYAIPILVMGSLISLWPRRKQILSAPSASAAAEPMKAAS
jgi:cytochrome c-type biogenesis protein CcmF